MVKLEVSLFPLSFPQGPQPYQVFTSNGDLLALAGDGMYRFDPLKNRWNGDDRLGRPYKPLGRGIRRFVFYHDNLFIAGNNWWHIDLETFRPVPLATEETGVPRYGVSAQYGLIGWGAEGVYQISIDEPARPAPVVVAPIVQPEENPVSYELPQAEGQQIVAAIERIHETDVQIPEDAKVIYGRCSLFDDWIPRANLGAHAFLDPPECCEGVKFSYVRGRVVRVDQLAERGPLYKVWYNENGAPTLAIAYDESARPQAYYWGEYGAAGLLCRVVHFDKDFHVKHVTCFESAESYASTTTRRFDSSGRVDWRMRHTADGTRSYYYPSSTPRHRTFKGTFTRFDDIARPRQYGLSAFYPIPGDSRAPVREP